MSRKILFSTIVLAVLLSQSWGQSGARASSTPERSTPDAIAALDTIRFIENTGQFASKARFRNSGSGYTLWLADDSIWITLVEKGLNNLSASIDSRMNDLHGVNLKISFPGANPHPRIEAFQPLDARISYFLGNDPGRW